MTELNKIIHDTARTYAEEFPGEALDPQWSATAYEIAGSDETGLSWAEYHSAVEAELAKVTRDTAAEGQETATDIHAVATPSTICPDREGAVDATVYDGDTEIGEVTLLPDPGNRGRLDTWGELSHWASDDVQRWLDAQEERQEAIDSIIAAVREAAR